MMRRSAPLLLALLASAPAMVAAQPVSPPPASTPAAATGTLQAELAGLSAPTAVFVIGPDGERGAASGLADPATGRALGVDTPMRIASNTKTFVAATVLRLWEQRRIDLDAPIGPLLSPSLDAILRGDGYDTQRITVRHLLSHSAGLYDHGSDPRYEATMLAEPGRKWTPEAQIRLDADYADPLGPPGAAFHYSDDDYILLGDIVQRITGRTLAAAVRRELGFERLGLRSTWWEVFEKPPRDAEPRAHQFLKGRDVTGVDASYDLYGGGGLVMSARDLATFFRALFAGQVFARSATLREMLWQGPHKDADKYRLGIFVRSTPESEFYWHSGFWGTYAAYNPRTGVAVAGMTTHQKGFAPMLPVLREALTRDWEPTRR